MTAAPKEDLGASSSHPSQGNEWFCCLSVPGCVALPASTGPLGSSQFITSACQELILSFCKEEGKTFLNTMAVLVQEEGASPHLMQSSSYLHNL